MKNIANKTYNIILVHGTFSPNADWVKPNSSFRNQLTELLGSKALNFKEFQWSGSNSHSARKVASHNLTQDLNDLPSTTKKHENIIIAHSHGGNVVLHALENNVIANKISRVIFLGTPYFHINQRSITEPFHYFLWSIVIGWFVGMVFIIRDIKGTDIENIVGWSMFIVFWILAFAADKVGPKIESKLFILSEFIAKDFMVLSAVAQQWVENERQRLYQPYSWEEHTQDIKLPSMLSISIQRDEAALWLRLLTQIGESPFVLWDNLVVPSRIWGFDIYLVFFLYYSDHQIQDFFWVKVLTGLQL